MTARIVALTGYRFVQFNICMNVTATTLGTLLAFQGKNPHGAWRGHDFHPD